MTYVPLIRVFLSSPGDVNEERKAVLDILERFPNRPAFREKVVFRVVAWDKPGADTPMLASISPQEAIDAGMPRPSDCDLVICIFWSRMGTPFRMDGVDYLSGTHYELLDALKSNRPETLIYRRTEERLFSVDEQDAVQQAAQLREFFESDLFYDSASRQIRRGVNTYATPADFHDKFELHLEALIDRLLEKRTRQPASAELLPANPVGTVLTLGTNIWKGSPFPGLRAFGKRDAPIFFGRSKETDALIKRVSESRFIAVVGASGSGKSSLVGAGLLPRLEANAISNEKTGSKDWVTVRFTPGSYENPFAALFMGMLDAFPQLRPSPFEIRRVKQHFVEDLLQDHAVLQDTIEAAFSELQAPDWAEVLFFVDQFEELFTLADPQFIQPFAALLHAISSHQRMRVIATMRSDFYHQAVENHHLAELLQAGSFPLASSSAVALAQMIKRPAERAALEFEEGLPEQILSDTGVDPGSLALLAYALDELYKIAEQRGERNLLFADYRALDGVHGAIGKRAEQIFAGLDGDDAYKTSLLSRVFRELVEVDERGTATRQRADRSRFGSDEMILIQAFAAGRLLVLDENHVEVAHEALFRSWERLKYWIGEVQEDLILLRQVRNAAHDWERKNYPNYLLWLQERLAIVYAMIERMQPELTEMEQEFIRPEQERLLRELEHSETSHERRRDIGDRLSLLGDPRRGIGVSDDGTPDMDWLPVSRAGEVTINDQSFFVNPFYIARYMVTYTQYEAFVEAEDGYDDLRWWAGMPDTFQQQRLNRQRMKAYNTPRDSISWYQSVAFSRWLNHRLHGIELPALEETGGSFIIGQNASVRLPYEWEWFWMARNGKEDRRYPWGMWKPEAANTFEAGLSRITAVGMYPAGAAACGALDVTGTLWEWCLNDYNDPAITNGYGNEQKKTLRGGSFRHERSTAACKNRNYTAPQDTYYFYGLRVCIGRD